MAKIKLIQIKGNTYFIPGPCNIGLVKEDDQVILIDSGNNSEAGRKVLKLIRDNGWELKLIINTHSNADHIGGNSFIQKRTNCKIAATYKESVFINHPEFEPSFLYGGFPWGGIQNKFLKALASEVTDIIANEGKVIETSMEAIQLPGHFYDMIGVRTADNVLHLADVLFSEEIISKYHIFFLYDVAGHLASLEKLKTLDADHYLISHGGVYDDISDLININHNKIVEIIEVILNICKKTVSFEKLLASICNKFEIHLNPNQYVLVGSTLRSYLSYLDGIDALDIEFENNQMVINSINHT